MLPILCHACGHRFQRTAAAVLADGACSKCASTDIDVDEAGLAAKASTSRTGTPSPKIEVTWTQNDGWRPGDPPRDPNYSDLYYTFRLDHTNGAPEPVNVIEAWVHDHTAFGKPDFRWEVDGTSQWGHDFSDHGNTADLATAKREAEAAVQYASDQFWSEYDDSPTPKGTPGGFPWDHRASKTADNGFSGKLEPCPRCGGGVLPSRMESHMQSQYCRNSYGTPYFTVDREIQEGKRDRDGRIIHRSALASDDLSIEQDPVEASFLNAWIDGVCVARIDTRNFDVRWIDGMDGRGANTLSAAKKAIQERLDRPSYRRLLTEAPVGVAWPKQASVAKVGAMALSIKDSNPEVPFSAAVALAREVVRRFPSVVSP